MVEYNLILLKGRGTKRRFNNKPARLVSRRVNSGGWVSVEVEGGGESIKWRSKAWKPCAPKKRSLSLADLQDGCLVHIFSFLGVGDHSPPISESELSRDFSDEELAADIDRSIDFVNSSLSLKQAVKLHKTIAFISKRFHSLCARRLPEILGHLDANLVLESWSCYTLWLTKYALRLKSLKLKSELLEDGAILLYILERCDVSGLTTLSACFKSFGPLHNDRTYTLLELVTGRLTWRTEDGFLVPPNEPTPSGVSAMRAASLGLPNLYER